MSVFATILYICVMHTSYILACMCVCACVCVCLCVCVCVFCDSLPHAINMHTLVQC